MGVSSSLYFLFFIFIFPFVPNAVPCLQSLVGRTQSNMSIPLYIASIRSSGVPIHMRYLGLFSGSLSLSVSSILCMSSLDSQTDSHQIATQGVSSFQMNSADCIRRSSYVTH